MKKILLTGGAGFIGRNIIETLQKFYEVKFPDRFELNLLDQNVVRNYLEKENFDIVIHCANPTPAKEKEDSFDRLMHDSLSCYFNLRSCSHLYRRMFYLGSGAEADKRFDIISVKEQEIGCSIPVDDYGFSKYIQNEDARKSDNVYNLRIWGIYGPTDAKSKFIRDAIDCCLENRSITIRQNCMFDYMFVEDLGRIICQLIEKQNLNYHDYNVCSGNRISLLEIANEVAKQMDNKHPIEIAKNGWNKEYTADNSRLKKELDDFQFTTIELGIAKQIEWQRSL